MSRLHVERHRVSRIGWLRAAVLGANDGLVSTASLIIGVAAAEATRGGILVAGAAGLVAGAMSMAAGEYVSVSSQSDTEKADIARETAELAGDRDAEVAELAGIYAARGLDPDLSRQVALQLMEKDALGAHARDELGISEFSTARPVQAAMTSALTFALGALPPLLLVLWVPLSSLIVWVGVTAPGRIDGARSPRRHGGGRRYRPVGAAGGLLGCHRHGRDRRHWPAVRNGRLDGTGPTPPP